MKNFKKLTLKINNTIQQAIKNLDESGMKIVLVTKNNKFIGTITDGDIRRGILQGISLKASIQKILNKNAIVCDPSVSIKELNSIMITNDVNSIPIIDKNKKIVDLKFLFEEKPINKNQISNSMVIMVGGKGKRLMPYTKFLPKTLLKVAGKPIIVHIIDRAKLNGYNNFILSINHLGTLIKKEIGNGRILNTKIKYIKEKRKLGTAGSLSLMKKILKKNFIVTNGDVITDINYNDLLKFHIKNNSAATMAIRSYEIKNPYGEIKTIGNEIIDYFEKPIYRSYINTGVYAFHPKILKLLNYNKEISMIQLFKKIKQKKLKVLAYPIHERWIDVGTPEHYFSAKKFIDD
tara:strand:+ start:4371 stop:5414 length:1044 start_codon:yes stop_codon:yes gene_type:complete